MRRRIIRRIVKNVTGRTIYNSVIVPLPMSFSNAEQYVNTDNFYNIIDNNNKPYNIITLGYDCSPAAALRAMQLREHALPFDWVISNVKSLEKCFHDNFANYHKGLYFNYNKKNLIDNYGFEFPHDYPLTTSDDPQIVENWQDYHEKVLEKYNRRIIRFLSIMQNPAPLIVLCRYNVNDVIKLKWLLHRYYGKTNVYFVNSCNPKSILNQRFDLVFHNYIINCYTEENDHWNETSIWRNALDQAIQRIVTK